MPQLKQKSLITCFLSQWLASLLTKIISKRITGKCLSTLVYQHMKYWKPLLIMLHPMSNEEHNHFLYFKRWLWYWWNWDSMFHTKTWPTDLESLCPQYQGHLHTGWSSWMCGCPHWSGGQRGKNFGRPCPSVLSFRLEIRQPSLLTVLKFFV